MSGHEPFSNLIDDSEARKQAADWAFDSLREGWSPETVEAQLLANGWSHDDATAIAETARKETRHLRGVVTQSDVSKAVQTAVRNRNTTLFNSGYIGTSQGFIDEQPAGHAAAPQGKVVSYASAPDKWEARRRKGAQFRAVVRIVCGSGLAALGLIVGLAMLGGKGETTTGSLILPGILLLAGVVVIYDGYREYSSPTRLVGKRDRGLLDRPER